MLKKITVLILVIFIVSCAGKQTNSDSITVATVNGRATVNGKPLQAGDEIKQGDTVKSADNSKIEIRIKGKAAVELRSLGELTFDTATSEYLELNLKSGLLLSTVKPGNKFSLRTPTAVAGVRGTTFFAKIITDDECYICLCEGRLAITSHNFEVGGIDASDNHHHPYSIHTEPSGEVSMKKEPMISHNDEQIKYLKRLLK